MKEYGIFLMILCLACFWSCQLMVDQPIHSKEIKNDVAVAAMKKWDKHQFDEVLQTPTRKNHQLTIYNSEQLDIMPLINDRCKGDLWRWSCTIDEFQQYLLSEIESEQWELFADQGFHKMLELIIDEKGQVIDVFTVLKKTKQCHSCEAMLREVVLSMPKWSPGVKDGKAVKTRLLIPFSSSPVS